MNLNGRLRLGPKRKELGIHRIGKHAQSVQSQHLQASRPALLQKNCNQQNNESQKMTTGHHISLKDKPQKFVQTDCMQSQREEPQTVESGTTIERCTEQHNEEIEVLTDRCKKLQERTSQLQEENEKLRVEAKEKGQLTNRVKVLQCELLNSDKEYYLKEISRLKSQCESLQIECANYKGQLSQTRQQQQEKDILANNKSEDIKRLQKQIEKERLANVEAKAKQGEQERALRLALEESEASNQMLCNKLQEMTRHLERQESATKQKACVIDSLNKQVQLLASRGRESEMKCQQIRKNYQQQISKHSRKLFQAEQVQKNTVKESQAVINRLSSDLETFKTQQAEQLINSNQIQRGLRTEEEDFERQLRVVRLQEQVKELTLALVKRDETIQLFQEKFKAYFSPQQYKGLERRCKQLEEKRLSSARYYEQRLSRYQKQNDQLRLQNINKASVPNTGSASFDEVLKNTLKESESLRAQVKRMSQALAISKEDATEIRLKEKQYLNELEILRKKTECSRKNYEIELEVERQKMTNEVDSLRRRLSTAETRLEYKIVECRKKDDFIKSTVVGRTTPLDKQTVLYELERVFAERDNQ